MENNDALALLRRNLKLLLFYLARQSDTPGADLEELLHEVIRELYDESRQALARKRAHLRLLC